MTASPSMQAYATEAANAAECGEQVMALWGKGLDDGDHSRRKLDWYYRRNPEGWPLVVFLLHGPGRQAVGVAAAGTRRMRHGDRTLTAGLMVDFVVAEEHRTLFPAIFLQKAICALALGSHALLYGIPNPRSLAAERRAGYRPVGAMIRRVRVLRVAPYLARHLPSLAARLAGALADPLLLLASRIRALPATGFRTQWLDRPDERFDDLFARAQRAGTMMGVRDRRFLDWRFVRCPFGKHRFFAVVSERDGRLAAYAVCDSHDRSLHVRDFLADPALPPAFTRLWSDLALAAHRAGHESLSVEVLGPAALHRRLGAEGLIARERQPVLAVLPGELAHLADEERWFLTNADDDN